MVVLSWQPQKPGVLQSLVDVGAASGSSRQPPKKPRVVQVILDVVFVAVGSVVWLLDVVVSSRQPNQQGVRHVEVVVVVTGRVVVVVVLVVSSRQPHHPGVLQVSVLVRVLVELLDEVVVVSELLD